MSNLKKYIGSMFDNHSVGASMRKILAFTTGVVFAAWLHYNYVDNTNAFEFLVADLACALLCLGIITMEQVIKFKHGSKENQEKVETDTTSPEQS
jgi:hypothetical protein